MTPEEEKLQLLGVIQANRHKLSPDEQQSFDEIVRQVGPRNVPGTLAYGLAQKRATSAARIPVRSQTDSEIGLDDRGYFHSLVNAIGIPTNMNELRQMGPTMAGNAFLPGLGSATQTVHGLVNSRSAQDVNRVLNPMVAPMEQMGEGNIRGGLGSMTPFVATSLAMPFIPAPGPEPVASGVRVPGNGMRINLLREGLPARSGLPEVWNGPPPSGTMPVFGEPTVVPPSRIALAGENAARKLASSVPIAGVRISDAIKGKIARPGMSSPVKLGEMDLSREAAYGNAPVQGSSRTTAFAKPRRIPVASELPELPDIWTGEEPQSIGNLDLEQPAVHGDAPIQPLVQPKTIGPDYDPRLPGGKFISRKSIPLKSDAVRPPKPVGSPQKSKPAVGFSTTEPAPATTTPSSAPTAAAPSFGEGDAVTLPGGSKVATVLNSNHDFTTVRTGKVTAKIPTSRLRLQAEAVEKAAPIVSTKNPGSGTDLKSYKVQPSQSVSGDGNDGNEITWTDSSGSTSKGRVRTRIKSRTGPAFIVTDATGKSRFVHSSKVQDKQR